MNHDLLHFEYMGIDFFLFDVPLTFFESLGVDLPDFVAELLAVLPTEK